MLRRDACLLLLEASFRRGVDAHALVEAFGGEVEAASAPLDRIAAIPGVGPAGALSLDEVRTEFDAVASHARIEARGLRFVSRACAEYPRALLAIDRAPLGLYVSGDASVLAKPCVAIVGARRATAYGLSLAEALARELAAAGVCVVSGLARGVDAQAHAGALETGVTAAVLGCGADVCYPREHRRLMSEVGRRGCVVSEYPPGTPPLKQNFPRRNRILSGVSLGVVVVEAGLRSGSLITASHALDQGRDVFAVPGDVGRQLSEGTNDLIKQGAIPVTRAGDVLEQYGIAPAPRAPGAQASPAELALLSLLEMRGTHADWLAERDEVLRLGSPLPALLASLVAKGLARRLPGNRYARTGGTS